MAGTAFGGRAGDHMRERGRSRQNYVHAFWMGERRTGIVNVNKAAATVWGKQNVGGCWFTIFPMVSD